MAIQSLIQRRRELFRPTFEFPASSVVASGGGIIDINGYRCHVFTDPGSHTFTITANPNSTSFQTIIVAGGGGGGMQVGGGGGGGQLQTINHTPGPGTYTIVVGAGANGTNNAQNQCPIRGNDSSAFGYTSTGGGRGGGHDTGSGCHVPQTGGGGGGGCGDSSSTSRAGAAGAGGAYNGGQGYQMNWCGGGGGGMGSAGGNGVNNNPGYGGYGGRGYQLSWYERFGHNGWFSAGGAGCSSSPLDFASNLARGGLGGGGSSSGNNWRRTFDAYNNSTNTCRGDDGRPNTGGGGAGVRDRDEGQPGNPAFNGGGNGGSGIVIIRYAI